MNSRLLNGLALLGAALMSAPAGAQQLVVLPPNTWAKDVTPDGSVVVGTANALAELKDGFIWRWREEPTPTIVPGGDMVAVSDDGSVVAGNFFDASIGRLVAGRWTAATGWQSIGWLPSASLCTDQGSDLSVAYDISGDGSTIVGLSWTAGCNGLGFRWTEATGMQQLQTLANGKMRATTISGNGSALGGFAQGTFSRTPAYWAPDTSGFVISADHQGEVLGFNENGSVSVGTLYFSGGTYSAFIRNQQTGALTNLGKLKSNWAGQAWDISEDGKTVVGLDFLIGARTAWVWTQSEGMISLNDRLTALGISGAPELWTAQACSDNGKVIVGGGLSPTAIVGYIVDLTAPQAQWTTLGHALAGSTGLPRLTASGALTAGNLTTVTLTNGKPGGTAWYVVGLSQIDAPFKQGVLVPSPDLIPATVTLPGSGSAALQFNWPAGLPSALSLYWQAWISDAGGPAGFAATNGVVSLTP